MVQGPCRSRGQKAASEEGGGEGGVVPAWWTDPPSPCSFTARLAWQMGTRAQASSSGEGWFFFPRIFHERRLSKEVAWPLRRTACSQVRPQRVTHTVSYYAYLPSCWMVTR